MPIVLVVLLVLLVGYGVSTAWARRRTRRRILDGSSAAAGQPGPPADPHRAANELRATIDAENGRGFL